MPEAEKIKTSKHHQIFSIRLNLFAGRFEIEESLFKEIKEKINTFYPEIYRLCKSDKEKEKLIKEHDHLISTLYCMKTT